MNTRIATITTITHLYDVLTFEQGQTLHDYLLSQKDVKKVVLQGFNTIGAISHGWHLHLTTIFYEYDKNSSYLDVAEKMIRIGLKEIK